MTRRGRIVAAIAIAVVCVAPAWVAVALFH